MNTIRTAMLLAFMTALFMGVGYLLGGSGGMFIALVMAAGMNLFSYWNADKMVLRMNRAVEVDERSAPQFYGIVRDLSARAGLPMPKVYIVDNPQPNAFATGRSPEHAAVCATTGLLSRLSHEEVTGVMAHELAHVKHRDTLTMTIVATLAGAIAMLGNFAFFLGGFGGNRNNNPFGFVGVLVAMIVAPLAAMMVQMAISRTREYEADRGGAEISGHPLWLASALAKIDNAAHAIVNPDAERNPATAHLFIINPLSGQRLDGLFTTHPSTESRIAALQEIAARMHETGMPAAAGPLRAAGDPAASRPAGPWGPRGSMAAMPSNNEHADADAWRRHPTGPSTGTGPAPREQGNREQDNREQGPWS